MLHASKESCELASKAFERIAGRLDLDGESAKNRDRVRSFFSVAMKRLPSEQAILNDAKRNRKSPAKKTTTKTTKKAKRRTSLV